MALEPPDRQATTAVLAPEERIRWDLIVLGVAVVVVILDQITKGLVLSRFAGPHVDDVIPVIGNVIVFEYLQNRGAAFSSFTQSPVLLTFLILIALGVIGWLYWTTRDRANIWLKLTFGMILGGAIGNLVDRFRLGYVVDFIHFQLPSIHYSFAVFNVADSGISVGIIALALLLWLTPRTEHIPEVPPISKSATPEHRAQAPREHEPSRSAPRATTQAVPAKAPPKAPAAVKARSATTTNHPHKKSSTKKRKRR